MTGPEDDDLPEPEIETIRNFSEVPEALRREIREGALLALGGEGVRGHAVDVRVMSKVLEHFDRLMRIFRAHRSGFEVKRVGRIVDVRGAKRLAALPAIAGSYAVPLRLEPPEDELVATDHQELEGVVELLGVSDEELSMRLGDLPERVGDELLFLLKAMVHGHVDLSVEAVRRGSTTARSQVGWRQAEQRSVWLVDEKPSEPGVDVLQGVLFRIDTKRARIAIDVSDDDDDATVVAEASFPLMLLEDLRSALHHEVVVEVDVVEERRRYERTARTRAMTARSVQRVAG